MAENNKEQISVSSSSTRMRSSQRAKVPRVVSNGTSNDLINDTVRDPLVNPICQDEPLNKHGSRIMASDDVNDYYSNSTFDEDERFEQQLDSTSSVIVDKEEMNFETRLLSVRRFRKSSPSISI